MASEHACQVGVVFAPIAQRAPQHRELRAGLDGAGIDDDRAAVDGERFLELPLVAQESAEIDQSGDVVRAQRNGGAARLDRLLDPAQIAERDAQISDGLRRNPA